MDFLLDFESIGVFYIGEEKVLFDNDVFILFLDNIIRLILLWDNEMLNLNSIWELFDFDFFVLINISKVGYGNV